MTMNECTGNEWTLCGSKAALDMLITMFEGVALRRKGRRERAGAKTWFLLHGHVAILVRRTFGGTTSE
jgi:hypothetical protein